jgi:hypothetical protein
MLSWALIPVVALLPAYWIWCVGSVVISPGFFFVSFYVRTQFAGGRRGAYSEVGVEVADHQETNLPRKFSLCNDSSHVNE